MKQYTTSEQTAKLIKQGLPQPRTKIPFEVANDELGYTYSIGELIDVLGVHLSSIYYIGIVWFVNAEGIERRREELIDALYDMVVKLKEEGVI